ncbi:phage tail assembly chaperone [Jiella sp. M17.18]|uniref:phage tail assembly chaperone n=1 Tax=Jiella sp. M17.18 TaxID=3234247 RepID=UPI0034DE5C6D
MAVGFGVLCLPHGAFWAMTPRELAAAVRARLPPAQPAPQVADLADLMRRFPDRG